MWNETRTRRKTGGFGFLLWLTDETVVEGTGLKFLSVLKDRESVSILIKLPRYGEKWKRARWGHESCYWSNI